jgi:hypothetical protein
MYDMKEQNLGKKCKYASKCPIFQGTEVPHNMDLTIWRNVFCYRGKKGWVNCGQFHSFERGRQVTGQEIKYRQH